MKYEDFIKDKTGTFYSNQYFQIPKKPIKFSQYINWWFWNLITLRNRSFRDHVSSNILAYRKLKAKKKLERLKK